MLGSRELVRREGRTVGLLPRPPVMKLAYLPLLAGLSPYCNRTATGLVQASTQRTKVVSNIAENPINEPNIRTHQDVL